MEKNGVLKIAVAAAVLAVVAFGGYYIGSRGKSVDGQAPQAATAQNYQDNGVNYSAIIGDLNAKLKAKPDDPQVLKSLGDAYFDLKQFNEAVGYYKKSIELNAKDADIYNDIGLSLHYLGKSSEGLKYIEEGIKTNPYHQRIWLTKGFLLAYGMGDIDGAKGAWEKAAALDPQSRIGKAASDYLAQINKK